MENLEEMRMFLPDNESEVFIALTPDQRPKNQGPSDDDEETRHQDLESLALDTEGDRKASIGSPPTVVLPNLKRLILEYLDVDNSFDALLQCIIGRHRAHVALEVLGLEFDLIDNFTPETLKTLRRWLVVDVMQMVVGSPCGPTY